MRNKMLLGRRNFSNWDRWYLEKLDDDTLRTDANAATKACGHGRLKHANGSYTDSGEHLGGVSRTVLDDYVPPVVLISDEE